MLIDGPTVTQPVTGTTTPKSPGARSPARPLSPSASVKAFSGKAGTSSSIPPGQTAAATLATSATSGILSQLRGLVPLYSIEDGDFTADPELKDIDEEVASRKPAPWSLANMVSQPLQALYGSTANMTRSIVCTLLNSTVRIGQLVLEDDSNGSKHKFGSGMSAAQAASLWPEYQLDQAVVLRVHHSGFYLRVLLGGLLGFCQAYMAAECDVGDARELSRLLALFAANQHAGHVHSRSELGGLSWLLRSAASAHHFLFRRNTRSGAKSNIERHYDLSNDLFATFLGPTMVYSCGYWREASLSLDEAQVRVLEACRGVAEEGRGITLTPKFHLPQLCPARKPKLTC